jgi:hypothetical protein
MRVPDHPTLIRRMLDSRLKRLAPRLPVLAASLVFYDRTCGNPTCHCLTGGAKHRSQHVTFKDDGKTRSVYVPLDLIADVSSWIDEHRRLKRLLREIQQLTLALIRTHVQYQKRKRGRP